MSVLKRLLLAALLGLTTLVITGCASDEETAMPWSRPQSWEGGVPGMGSSPGTGR